MLIYVRGAPSSPFLVAYNFHAQRQAGEVRSCEYDFLNLLSMLSSLAVCMVLFFSVCCPKIIKFNASSILVVVGPGGNLVCILIMWLALIKAIARPARDLTRTEKREV